MSDLLHAIVREDEKVSAILASAGSNRLTQLSDLLRLTADREALINCILCRLLLEHDRRKLLQQRESER